MPYLVTIAWLWYYTSKFSRLAQIFWRCSVTEAPFEQRLYNHEAHEGHEGFGHFLL